MSEEKKYHQFEEEEGAMYACEPVGACTAPTTQPVVDDIDYNFGFHDLGFPRTIDEVKAELLEAEAAWDDDSQWSTSEEMRAEIKQTFPQICAWSPRSY